MSRKCQITQKKALTGFNVSHANNKTKKTWQVNLHKKRIFDSETGQWYNLRVSSRALRTIDKIGLSAALRKNGLSLKDVT